MTILWSAKAEEDFESNIIYLLENWSIEVVQDFTSETEKVLNILTINPKAFQENKAIRCHVVPITKQITLFYEIKKKQIILLRFWNAYQNPRTLKIKPKK
jgi:plasmid stabilization system protein ParE